MRKIADRVNEAIVAALSLIVASHDIGDRTLLYGKGLGLTGLA